MANTNDEVNARKVARERRAKMQAEQVERDERIDQGVVDAVLSAKQLEEARAEVSRVEDAFADALAAHEEHMGRIVAAFKGEKLNVDSIAGLLELSPRQVRRLGKLADKPASHPDDAPAQKPPLTDEQNGPDDA